MTISKETVGIAENVGPKPTLIQYTGQWQSKD